MTQENNDIEYITIKMNVKIYYGFQHKMKKNIFNSLSTEDVVYSMKTIMKSFFNKHNLFSLEKGVDEIGELHFHDDIPHNRPIVYLCDDDHGTQSK